uniref:Uncharacterized protein n=1 Tax=Triticum urartu TaxID=4572 RepID=A0A8R7QCG4_TRIUA
MLAEAHSSLVPHHSHHLSHLRVGLHAARGQSWFSIIHPRLRRLAAALGRLVLPVLLLPPGTRTLGDPLPEPRGQVDDLLLVALGGGGAQGRRGLAKPRPLLLLLHPLGHSLGDELHGPSEVRLGLVPSALAASRPLVLLGVVVVVGVPLAEDAVEGFVAGLGRALAAALVVELPVAAAHEDAVHVEAVLLHG